MKCPSLESSWLLGTVGRFLSLGSLISSNNLVFLFLSLSRLTIYLSWKRIFPPLLLRNPSRSSPQHRSFSIAVLFMYHALEYFTSMCYLRSKTVNTFLRKYGCCFSCLHQFDTLNLYDIGPPVQMIRLLVLSYRLQWRESVKWDYDNKIWDYDNPGVLVILNKLLIIIGKSVARARGTQKRTLHSVYPTFALQANSFLIHRRCACRFSRRWRLLGGIHSLEKPSQMMIQCSTIDANAPCSWSYSDKLFWLHFLLIVQWSSFIFLSFLRQGYSNAATAILVSQYRSQTSLWFIEKYQIQLKVITPIQVLKNFLINLSTFSKNTMIFLLFWMLEESQLQAFYWEPIFNLLRSFLHRWPMSTILVPPASTQL